jgi:FkbM family methyltransferase
MELKFLLFQSFWVTALVLFKTFGFVVAGESKSADDRFTCVMPPNELAFNSIIYAMFLDNMIPDGDILDCGANDGEWTCMYGCIAPDRAVRALEPFKTNYDKISCPNQPNVIKYPIGLSSSPGFFEDGNNPNTRFRLKNMREFKTTLPKNKLKMAVQFTTIDYFFNQTMKTAPGFMHLDVEGYELAALKGGKETILKYKPVITFEAHVLENKDLVKHLFIFIEDLGYKTFMVSEVCGTRKSCRNFIAIPNALFQTVSTNPIFTTALRSGEMAIVHSTNLFTEYERLVQLRPPFAWVFPAKDMKKKKGWFSL